jgi:hypothetical protein
MKNSIGKKKRKAPKVPKYNMDKNYMKEYNKSSMTEKNGTKMRKNKTLAK